VTHSSKPVRTDGNLVVRPMQQKIAGIVLTAAFALAVVVPFSALWGFDLLWQDAKAYFPLVLAAFFVGIFVHEWLHAISFRIFGGVTKESISYRRQWKTLDIQTMCAAPMTAGAYRIAALMPALLMGLVPAAISLAYGIGWLAVWSVLALNSVTSDIVSVWAIRSMGNSERVFMNVDPAKVDFAAPDKESQRQAESKNTGIAG